MQTATRSDPMKAFNERARAAGWTFTCGPATGFDHPALSAALALWREKAKGRTMPSRADSPPHDGEHTPGAHEGSNTSMSKQM